MQVNQELRFVLLHVLYQKEYWISYIEKFEVLESWFLGYLH